MRDDATFTHICCGFSQCLLVFLAERLIVEGCVVQRPHGWGGSPGIEELEKAERYMNLAFRQGLHESVQAFPFLHGIYPNADRRLRQETSQGEPSPLAHGFLSWDVVAPGRRHVESFRWIERSGKRLAERRSRSE
jgi:hypothetical protein